MEPSHNEIRKAISKVLPPGTKFKVKLVDFTDTMRDKRFVIESDSWGITKGQEGRELFRKAKEAVLHFDPPIIVMF